MVFATVAIGEKRKNDLLHLLNDIRNINKRIYVLIDFDLDLNFYRFDNVDLIKTTKNWTDFRRFELLKYIFENTEEEMVYYVDCDSRFFDFREEKYNNDVFENLLNSLDFDLLYSWNLGYEVNVEWHLNPPIEGENKEIRNYTYGHPQVISYIKEKIENYDEIIKKSVILESVLIFKKSDNLVKFIDELIYFGNLVENCDKEIGRKHVAHGTGFAMSLFYEHYNIKIVKNHIVSHYFKANFLNEVFLWGLNMDKNLKLNQIN